MSPPKLLLLPGSARQASLNRRLAHVAADLAAQAGFDPVPYDPAQLRMPVYDGDLEAASGAPEEAVALLEALRSTDALLLVTPEYNGFPTPLVINAFDWLSRVPAQGDRPAGLAVTANRPAGVLSASPGPLGGLRSLNYVRQYLQANFQMIVVPQQFALSKAGEAFDEAGALKDPKASQAITGVLQALARLTRGLAG
jgi:NAD(P)H-dependent FMN reductase